VVTGYLDGDVERGIMPAGQSVQNIHDVLPAGEIVRRMSGEAEKIIGGDLALNGACGANNQH
jgi:NAD(P)H-dependent flavin oxidoreductase YrpB (nitropropane dioxygenase family)